MSLEKLGKKTIPHQILSSKSLIFILLYFLGKGIYNYFWLFIEYFSLIYRFAHFFVFKIEVKIMDSVGYFFYLLINIKYSVENLVQKSHHRNYIFLSNNEHPCNQPFNFFL